MKIGRTLISRNDHGHGARTRVHTSPTLLPMR